MENYVKLTNDEIDTLNWFLLEEISKIKQYGLGTRKQDKKYIDKYQAIFSKLDAVKK